MILTAVHHRVRFPRPAVVMGILNVTPDSFFDGGRFRQIDKAIEHGLRMAEAGAEILDVGGESTRPGAAEVSEEEECGRVVPVIAGLASRCQAMISVDTRKAGVARRAVELGACIVNDVGAAARRPELWKVVAETGAGYVLMHMQGTPETMQLTPAYRDVVGEVRDFFVERLKQATEEGVASEQVMLDVGIGFGKRLEHNLALLARLGEFKALGRPLVVGLSRKSLIGEISGAAVEDRMPGSLAGACWAALAGAGILRVHDVSETMQALRVLNAVMAAPSGGEGKT